jgi:S1-C subfamily serine protease
LNGILRATAGAVLAALAICGGAVEHRAAAEDASPPAGARVKSGTAFFVTAKGDLVTSAHVVAGCPSISIFGRDGVQRPATLVAADRRLDIALMRASDPQAKHVGAFDPQNFPIGQEVHAIGYGVIARDPRRAVLSRGTYVGFGTTPAGALVRVIRLRLREGESGGPVINSRAELLGMAIGRYTDRPELGVLVPTRDIADFLRSQGVKLSPSSAALGRDPRDVLLAVAVLVQCLPPSDRQAQAAE